MPEIVATTIALPSIAPQIGGEVSYADDLYLDGIYPIGEAINSLLGRKLPMCILDPFRTAFYPLTPGDLLPPDGFPVREWQFKTPSYLGITGAENLYLTLQVQLAKTKGTGMEYKIYMNGVLVQTYAFGTPAFSLSWQTISTVLVPDDTLDFQTLRITQSSWHGGSNVANCAYAIRVFPVAWPNIANQNSGWREYPGTTIMGPVPNAAYSTDAAVSSYLIQSMQKALRFIYRRRITTLYSSSAWGTGSGTSTSSGATWCKVRINAPPGVTQVKARFFAVNTYDPASGTQFVGIRTPTQTSTIITNASQSWVEVSATVTPGVPEVWMLLANKAIVASTFIYCVDPV